jgi:hypothetical protein
MSTANELRLKSDWTSTTPLAEGARGFGMTDDEQREQQIPHTADEARRVRNDGRRIERIAGKGRRFEPAYGRQGSG